MEMITITAGKCCFEMNGSGPSSSILYQAQWRPAYFMFLSSGHAQLYLETQIEYGYIYFSTN